MTHPIPVGRRAALHDPAFWRPLKGLVSVITERFALPAETAGTMLYDGMSSGEIGHRRTDLNAHDWIISPRGAELARLAGLSYDDHIDWREGLLHPPGARSYPLEIYWPDVERAARTLAKQADADVRPAPNSSLSPVRAAYSEGALAAWFVLREATWPPDQPPPNEAADMEAAKRQFESTPARDEFRRIRQAKTSEQWRKPGPRNRR